MEKDLIIGFVYGGALDPEFVRSLFRTAHTQERLQGVIMQPSPSGMVPASRNAVVRQFLQSDARWLLWLNTDKEWAPNMVTHALATAEEKRFLILSAHIRNPGPDQYSTVPVMVDARLQPIEPSPSDRFINVFCAGMGFYLTHRAVYEQVQEAYADKAPCEWFDYETWEGKTTGEDLVFSKRLKRLGIPTVVDQTLLVGHRKVVSLYPPNQT